MTQHGLCSAAAGALWHGWGTSEGHSRATSWPARQDPGGRADSCQRLDAGCRSETLTFLLSLYFRSIAILIACQVQSSSSAPPNNPPLHVQDRPQVTELRSCLP